MAERPRKIAFTIIAAVLSLITLWIAAGFCSLVTEPLLNAGDIDNINIDGSDWTGMFRLGATMVNGVLTAVFILIFGAIEIVITPTAWGIFRCNAFKKNPVVSKKELSYSLKVFLISSFGTLAAALAVMIACAVKAHSGAPFWGLLMCWLNPLLMWAMYISKLKKLTV